MNVKQVISAAIDVFFPRHCPVCKCLLNSDERYICHSCLLKMPRTGYEDDDFNAMEQLFAGKTPIERATACFYYEKQSPYAAVLHDIKYHDMPQMGRWLAHRIASEWNGKGVFEGIDYLIPVPLHYTKLVKRGYNQSDYIAQGIGEHTGITIYEAVRATQSHATQTRKSAMERLDSAQGLYAPVAEANCTLRNKHVMIVDDVVTTGATLLACAESIARIDGIKISLFALSVTRLR